MEGRDDIMNNNKGFEKKKSVEGISENSKGKFKFKNDGAAGHYPIEAGEAKLRVQDAWNNLQKGLSNDKAKNFLSNLAKDIQGQYGSAESLQLLTKMEQTLSNKENEGTLLSELNTVARTSTKFREVLDAITKADLTDPNVESLKTVEQWATELPDILEKRYSEYLSTDKINQIRASKNDIISDYSDYKKNMLDIINKANGRVKRLIDDSSTK